MGISAFTSHQKKDFYLCFEQVLDTRLQINLFHLPHTNIGRKFHYVVTWYGTTVSSFKNYTIQQFSIALINLIIYNILSVWYLYMKSAQPNFINNSDQWLFETCTFKMCAWSQNTSTQFCSLHCLTYYDSYINYTFIFSHNCS